MEEEDGIEIQLVNSICAEEGVGKEIRLVEKVERSISKDLVKFREEADVAHTIFTVPDFVRTGEKETHYSPIVISIGPYHRDPSNFKATEDHKRSFLHDLLSRHPDSDQKLKACIAEIANLEEKARRCYDKKIQLNRDEFVKVLLMDGCFIIELLYKSYSRHAGYMLSGGWSGHLVWIDLLKLENQIPFFVLEKLYQMLLDPRIPEDDWLVRSKQKHPLRELALMYLTQSGTQFRLNKYQTNAEYTREVHHLLHLYYLYHTPSPESKPRFYPISSTFRPNIFDTLASLLSLHNCIRRVYINAKRSVCAPSSDHQTGKSPIKVPSATQLEDDGVKFKKKKRSGSFYNIKFNRRRGLMAIPQLKVSMETWTLSLNLIAYEEIKCTRKYLISFAFLMDCLIDSPKDVAVLRKHNIIISDLEDKELAKYFNQLCRSCYLTIENCEFTELSREVEEYCEFKLYKGRTYLRKLKLDYFSNPWAWIAFLAACILLGLTIVQTIFSVLSYIHPLS